jgi:hypothetical protein
MSLQTQDALHPVLTQMQVAERELAMYAAIIGHRPSVEPAETNPSEPAPQQTTCKPHAPTLSLHTFHLDSAELKTWVSGWVKQMSHQAKRRIDEAKMRLAG